MSRTFSKSKRWTLCVVGVTRSGRKRYLRVTAMGLSHETAKRVFKSELESGRHELRPLKSKSTK